MRYRYSILTRFFHWAILLGLLALYPIGIIMSDLPPSGEKWQLYAYHQAVGLIMLVLILMRFINFLYYKKPNYEKPMQKIHERVGEINFKIMYLLLLLIPITGLSSSLLSGHPISFFGLFTLAPIFSTQTIWGNTAHEIHGIVPYLLLFFLFFHIAGALYHQFIEKSKFLRRIF